MELGAYSKSTLSRTTHLLVQLGVTQKTWPAASHQDSLELCKFQFAPSPQIPIKWHHSFVGAQLGCQTKSMHALKANRRTCRCSDSSSSGSSGRNYSGGSSRSADSGQGDALSTFFFVSRKSTISNKLLCTTFLHHNFLPTSNNFIQAHAYHFLLQVAHVRPCHHAHLIEHRAHGKHHENCTEEVAVPKECPPWFHIAKR